MKSGSPFPRESGEAPVGVTAEVEPCNGLLPGVAALFVRDCAELVEPHLLRQCPLADLGTEARPARHHARELQRTRGRPRPPQRRRERRDDSRPSRTRDTSAGARTVAPCGAAAISSSTPLSSEAACRPPGIRHGEAGPSGKLRGARTHQVQHRHLLGAVRYAAPAAVARSVRRSRGRRPSPRSGTYTAASPSRSATHRSLMIIPFGVRVAPYTNASDPAASMSLVNRPWTHSSYRGAGQLQHRAVGARDHGALQHRVGLCRSERARPGNEKLGPRLSSA